MDAEGDAFRSLALCPCECRCSAMATELSQVLLEVTDWSHGQAVESRRHLLRCLQQRIGTGRR